MKTEPTEPLAFENESLVMPLAVAQAVQALTQPQCPLVADLLKAPLESLPE